MAKSKVTNTETTTEVISAPIIEQDLKQNSVKSEPSMQDMMAMFAQMQQTINSLQSKLEDVEREKEELAAKAATPSFDDKTSEILERLVNKKSEREVILVHNRELFGGLSTYISLTGLTIEFHTMGEQRMLTWAQAEECVSKYYHWFQKGIILLGPGSEDLAERYNVPCVSQKKAVLTRVDIQNIYTKSEKELEDYVENLDSEDQDFVFSYWLGKCYENDPNYVVRSKIELLNRLSGRGAFDNYLTGLNFSSVTNR